MKTKRITLLLTTIVLTLGLILGVSASSITYEGGAEEFVFLPGSGYTSTDLFDNFKNVMPGDKLTEEITIKNNSRDSDYIKLYMQAIPHDESDNPLTYSEAYENTDGKDQADVEGVRDETAATMRDFLNKLTMTVTYTDDNGSEVRLTALPSEEENDLTGNGICLGSFRKGEKIKLKVTLEVPIDLGNEYANRVGEVDWLFTAEHRSDPEPDYPITPINPNITVRKVWVDSGIGRPASIKVNLLRDGMVYDTIVLSEKNNWSHSWPNMDRRYEWSVEEDEVPEGYVATYKKNGSGWVTTITNTKILANELTVEKVWEDDDWEDRPGSVDVVLLRNGEYFDEAELNDRSDWTHTWRNLSVNDSWSVVEKSVPEGYRVSYSYDEAEEKIIVTNTLEEIKPGEDEAETTELTVNKVWADDGTNRPDSIKVYLLRDGELADTVEVTAADDWTYTWTELPAEYSWSIIEAETAGYTAEYAVNGTEVTITNTAVIVKEPYDITVKKVWSDNGDGRPSSAEVVLYNGETAVETVVLSEQNNWTHTWTNLDGDGNWQVIEDSVPVGYTPSYEVTDGVVTITNTATLIQTGQTKWPIPVLCIGGVLLIGAGVVMMFRKRKDNA